jgi:hypothetical protein
MIMAMRGRFFARCGCTAATAFRMTLCVPYLLCFRFFIFVAYLFLLHQMGIALFRFMGALGEADAL